MRNISKQELQSILEQHANWLAKTTPGQRADLSEANLSRANLSEANLIGANLSGADLASAKLYGANLSGANLSGADLSRANLYRADLSGANLSGAGLFEASLFEANLTGANLSGANLYKANLTGANLFEANLTGADLTGANLSGANLTRADLTNTVLPHYKIYPEEGTMIGFKKLRGGVIAKLQINCEDIVAGGLLSRKCRATKAKVLALTQDGVDLDTCVESLHTSAFKYKVLEEVTEPNTSRDIREECAPGIHFFITRKEAEEYI